MLSVGSALASTPKNSSMFASLSRMCTTKRRPRYSVAIVSSS